MKLANKEEVRRLARSPIGRMTRRGTWGRFLETGCGGAACGRSVYGAPPAFVFVIGAAVTEAARWVHRKQQSSI